MEKLAIPIGISFDGLVEVIKSWYIVGAVEKSLNFEEVAEKSNQVEQTFRRVNKFLIQVGILQEKNRGTFQLTKTGANIAKYATYSLIEDFRSSFQDLIRNWEEVRVILEYIETKNRDIDTIVKRIMMESERAPTDKNVEMGARTILQILSEVGLVSIDEDSVYVSETYTGIESPYLQKRGLREAYFFDRIIIQNVRSIKHLEAPLGKLNILIGENGSGKSSVLYAILALRNLMWERQFASSAYHELALLQRYGSKESMNIILERNNISDESSRFLVSFTPEFSYCTQLCVQLEQQRICDVSVFVRREDLKLPINLLVGLEKIKEIIAKMKEGAEKLAEALQISLDNSVTPEEKKSWRIFQVSGLEDEKGNYEEIISEREFLGPWPGIFPETIRDSSREIIRNIYKESRVALKTTIDSIEFVPAIRGFLSLSYSQKDGPPYRVGENPDYASDIVNRMIFPEQMPKETMTKIQNWAEKFGIRDFEVILKTGPKVEARGRPTGDSFTLPIALHALGSNQFLSLITKCILADKGAPILIEEPEIHLHPEYQALSADFLIDIMKEGHQVFVTTHSEHLIGRIQRRIAEGKLLESDVSILWIKKEKDFGTTAEKVEIDENGIFKDDLLAYMKFAEQEFRATEEARMKKE